MRCNAASLMAGGGAVCLNFDTESMQNIIKTSGGAFKNMNEVQIYCIPERWVNLWSSCTHSRGKFSYGHLPILHPPLIRAAPHSRFDDILHWFGIKI